MGWSLMARRLRKEVRDGRSDGNWNRGDFPRSGLSRLRLAAASIHFSMNALIRSTLFLASGRKPASAPTRFAGAFQTCLRTCSFALVFLSLAASVQAAAPADIGFTTLSINQSLATTGAAVATLSTLDTDLPGDTHTYSLVLGIGSTDNGSFAIVGNSLNVGPVALTPRTYAIRIRTTDSTALFFEEAATITVVDNVPPVITGAIPPPNGSYSAGSALTFTVYFTEPITVNTSGGVPRLALTLNTGGTVYANYFSGSGSLALLFRYTIAPGDLDPDGVAVAAAIEANGGTLRDAAANNAVLTINGLGSTAGVIIDGVQLSVLSVAAPAAGTYKIGAAADFTVTFSKTTYVDLTGGAPRIPVLLESSTPAFATYVSGHASTDFVFRYTVASGDFDTNGVMLGTAIESNGAIIRDASSNVAIATLNNVAVLTAVRVDGVPPTVASILRIGASPTTAASVTYAVTFAEPVSGVDISDFVLTTTGTATGSLGTVTQPGVSNYEVTVNSILGDGTIRLDLKSTGTGIIDALANPLVVGFSGGQEYVIDRTSPTLAISAPSVASTETGPVVYTLTYSAADTITLTPAQVTLNTTGSATATVEVAGTGSTTRTVTLTGITGAGTVGISIAAATASDLAGNLSLAAGPSDTVPVNRSPVLVTPIPNQTIGYRTPFTFTVPAGTFVEPNGEQTLTYTATGLPTGITFDGTTRSFAGISPIGSTQVTVTATDNGVPIRSTSSTFTLNIIKAVLTVKADDKNRAYGSINPPLTVTYTGFVAGETLETSGVTGLPVISTTATGTTPVGAAPISVTVGTLAATNYSFVFVPGVLTIAKAPLTVTADNKTRVYNSINPLLTYSLTGLVNGETAAVISGEPVLATEVNAVTNAGTYPITISLGTLTSGNYAFSSLVNGTFTVSPASLTITLQDLFQVYNGQPRAVSALTIPSGGRVKFTYNGNAVPPTDAGSYTVIGTSEDPNYAGTVTATLSVAKAPQTIAFNPGAASIGVPVQLTATSSSGLPVTFTIISGTAALNGDVLTLGDNNPVTVRAVQAGNANYSTTSVDRTLSASERLSQSILFASPGNLTTDAAPFVLQTGATSGLAVTATLQSGPALLSGNTVTLTGSVGTVTLRLSQAGNATYAPAPDLTVTFNVNLPRNDRIINLSSRSRVKTDAGRLITGFVIGGNAPKQILIRGIGPSLTQFNVDGVMTAPTVQLYRDTTLISENTGWTSGGNAAVLSAAFARLGAFALTPNSADSALLVTLAPGGYSTHVFGGSGVALAEIYDASVNPQAEMQRLVNISVRNDAGSGADVLIAGFVITGTTPKRVLVRGVGPGLVQFQVTNALVDPSLRVFADQTQIAENDNWSAVTAQAVAVAEAGLTVGAFPLQIGSKDSALVLTLAPGGYTVQASSAIAGNTGVALIEVYELP